MTMLDPFGRSQLPQDFSREGRVALLGEAFEALMRGELPRPEARIFLASAGLAWLARGGDLQRDFLRVVKPKSHVTPDRIWRRLKDESDSSSE